MMISFLVVCDPGGPPGVEPALRKRSGMVCTGGCGATKGGGTVGPCELDMPGAGMTGFNGFIGGVWGVVFSNIGGWIG